MLRFGSGRLSEIFGDLTLPLDRFIRAVGWNRAARRLCAQWDDLSWEMSEAFAAGVRAWLSHMPAKPVEYEILQLDPYFPDDREAAELAAAARRIVAAPSTFCERHPDSRRGRARTTGSWRDGAARPAGPCWPTTPTCSPSSPRSGTRSICPHPGSTYVGWPCRSHPA